jgi:glycosyltransferase involved in cell wall biosynthesis
MSDTHKPLKIAFILPALMSGGAERVLITLMNSLDRTRYTPVLLSVSDKGELRSIVDEGISVITLNKDRMFKSLPWLLNALKKQKPDIVVSTMAHTNFTVLLLKPFFPKTRFIVREAITPSFFFEKYKSRRHLLKTMYKLLYPRADLILSPTKKVFEEFRRDLGFESRKFTHLPNPVDLENIRKACNFPEIDEKRRKTVHFIAAGRLEPQKGYDRLIEALPHFNPKYDWQLTILGEGSQRGELETLISRHNLTDKITLKGLVQKPYADFAAADCFVLPSRHEGLPNVILESLACGTPVIATKESGGIDEIANAANENDVQVVENMEVFLQAMEQVLPSPAITFRPSLLPKMYSRESIAAAFDGILKQVNA